MKTSSGHGPSMRMPSRYNNRSPHSWWVGVSRDELRYRAERELGRMTASKEFRRGDLNLAHTSPPLPGKLGRRGVIARELDNYRGPLVLAMEGDSE